MTKKTVPVRISKSLVDELNQRTITMQNEARTRISTSSIVSDAVEAVVKYGKITLPNHDRTKTSTSYMIEAGDIEKFEQIAKAANLSINAAIEYAIRQHLDNTRTTA